MFQSWIPGLDLDNPSNLAFPTWVSEEEEEEELQSPEPWVSLRNLAYEHHDLAHEIVETLGEVIGVDASNDKARNPKSCIDMIVSKGWATNILEYDEGILPP